jgi:hypothetical protein
VTVSYETAVYVEDVQLLTDEIVALIRARTEHVPKGHLRDAIIGASLITAAQELDGLSVPHTWRRGGRHGHDPAHGGEVVVMPRRLAAKKPTWFCGVCSPMPA